MINVLVVSEYNIIKELLRSALRIQPNVENIILSHDGELSSFCNKYSFDFESAVPDIILYDLDSASKDPQAKLERMLNDFQSIKSSKVSGALSSLIVVSSDKQLNVLQKNVHFIDTYVIRKPFTFKQVIQVVNDVWTSSSTIINNRG